MVTKEIEKNSESSKQTEQKKEFFEDCETLKRELQHAIEDISFEREGGKIRFAVDFSEIYVYLLPNETPKESVKKFLLFADELEDEPTSIAEQLQRLALERLFQDSEKLILLSPYAIELDAFLSRHHSKLEESRSQRPDLDREIAELSSKTGFELVKNLIKKFELSSEKLSADERDQILDFFEQHAKSLLSLLETQESKPIDSLKKLFVDERFENLQDLVDVAPSSYNETSEEWYEKLVEVNPGKVQIATFRLDSIAIAMVEQANKELQRKNIRLLLVARSDSMHEAVKQEAESQSSKYSILRHPRVLNIRHGVEAIYEDRALQQLKTMKQTVEQILESRAQKSQGDIKEPQNEEDRQQLPSNEDLQQLIEKIKQEYRKIATWVLTFQKAEDSAKKDNTASPYYRLPAEARFNLIKPILLLLKDPINLKKLASKRLTELIDTWEQDQEFLGLSLRILNPQQQKFFQYILQTPLEDSPYFLNFYSAQARKSLEQLRNSSWPEIFKFLKQAFSEDLDYESFLVRACIFGTLDCWNLAEQCCELALAQVKDGDDPHEGYYFRAVCMRKRNLEQIPEQQIPERRLKAIDDLDKAIKPQTPGKPDPRYLLEKGIHILYLNIEFEEKVKDKPDFSAQEGLDLLREAEKLSVRDRQLQIRIRNNRLFYYIEDCIKKGELEDERMLNNSYRQLEKLQKKEELDRSKWPPYVLHTLAWAKWHLKEALTEAKKQEILNMLEQALNSDTPPSPTERKTILQHLDRIKQGKRTLIKKTKPVKTES